MTQAPRRVAARAYPVRHAVPCAGQFSWPIRKCPRRRPLPECSCLRHTRGQGTRGDYPVRRQALNVTCLPLRALCLLAELLSPAPAYAIETVERNDGVPACGALMGVVFMNKVKKGFIEPFRIEYDTLVGHQTGHQLAIGKSRHLRGDTVFASLMTLLSSISVL